MNVRESEKATQVQTVWTEENYPILLRGDRNYAIKPNYRYWKYLW